MTVATETERFTPSVIIKLDGQTTLKKYSTGNDPATELNKGTNIASVSIIKDSGSPALAEVELTIFESGQTQDKPYYVDVVKEGCSLEIKLGWTAGSEKTVFIGEVCELELNLTEEGASTLLIRGYDKLHRLTRGTFYKTWEKSQLSGVVSDVVGKVANDGLKANTDTTQTKYDWWPLMNSNLYEYISAISSNVGLAVQLECDPSGSPTGTSVKWGASQGTSEVLQFDRENPKSSTSNFVGMNLVIRTANQIGEVEVRGWDPKTKKAVTGSSTKVTKAINKYDGPTAYKDGFQGKKKILIPDQPVVSAGEAKEIAKAVFDSLAMSYVEGTVTSIGHAEFDVGKTIKLVGFGERLSGTYVIVGLTHRLPKHEKKGWVTDLRIAGNSVAKKGSG